MPINSPILPKREEYLKKKRKQKILRYSLIFFAFAIIVGVASYISHRKEIRIRNVTLSGGVLVHEEEVSKEALSYVQGSYLFLFPRNNALWYPHKTLANHLKETFRRIDTINFHLKDFHTLAIDITERKPVAIWCKNIPVSEALMEDGSEGEGCFFMDQNSTIFAVAPYFSGDAYFKYYGGIEGDPLGKEYLASSTVFYDISLFVDVVKEFSLRPLYLVAREDSDYALVIAGGGEIYFDTKESLSQVAENLEALLRSETFSKSPRNNLPIQYIDLRYGNKLFYKLR